MARGKQSVIDLFQSVGITLDKCEACDTYCSGKVANYFVEFSDCVGWIWVTEQGELATKYTPESFRSFLDSKLPLLG